MENLNDMFSQFAEAFVGNMVGEGDIAYRDKIDGSLLNYSIDSLHHTDDYLRFVHQNPVNESSIEYQNIIVWCGAYVGEVIRRNAVIQFAWVDYNDYMKGKKQDLQNLVPYMLSTHALLATIDATYMTMPLNKIARWLAEGEEHNVHYYAGVDIARKSIDKTTLHTAANPAKAAVNPWWKFGR